MANSPDSLESIDHQIRSLKGRIDSLENDKRMHVLKAQGVSKVRAKLDELLQAHDLSEREYLTVISDRIVTFIKDSEPKAGEGAPRFWTDLAEYFGAVKTRRKAAKKESKAQTKQPKGKAPLTLKAGLYRNPHTGETLQKIKRPTREFQAWIDEYGAEVVAGWRQ